MVDDASRLPTRGLRIIGLVVIVLLVALATVLTIRREGREQVEVTEAVCTSFGSNRHPVWFVRDGWEWDGDAAPYWGAHFSGAASFTSDDAAEVDGPDGSPVSFRRGSPVNGRFVGVACTL